MEHSRYAVLAGVVIVLASILEFDLCAPDRGQPGSQTAQPVEAMPDFVEALPRPYELAGPLIPSAVTMVSAWDIPKNPLTDSTLDHSWESERIRRGYRLFVNTPGETPRFTPGGMSCNNCHLNAGQRELALPLVGAAGMFPEYNKRAGRMFSLEDRIVGCFWRSENAVGGARGARDEDARDDDGAGTLPSPTSDEVVALSAYLGWLSEGYPAGVNPPWRKQNRIPAETRLPIDQLDPHRGESLFAEKCASCHGPDGQGVQIGDKKAGPLWGSRSWNDGAGAARFFTLAGFIRYAMPYLDPGSLTDEEAQHLAAFIISKPRPAYPFKAQDYQKEPVPVDAWFYRR